MPTKTILLSGIFALTCCTSPTEKPINIPPAKECAQPLETLAHHSPGSNFHNSTHYTGGKIASYLYTGTGYTIEVLIGVAAIASVLGVYAYFMCGRNGCASTQVQPSTGGSTGFWPAPSLGHAAKKESRQWHCPDLSPLFEAIYEVALCLEKKETQDGLLGAYRTIDSIRNSKDVYICLTDRQIKSLTTKMEELRPKIDIFKEYN